MCREHEHGSGLFVHDPLDGLDTTHARHLEVHRDRVGGFLFDDLERLGSVGGLADHRHPGVVKQIGDQPAHEPRVVDDDCPRLTHPGHPRSGVSDPDRDTTVTVLVGERCHALL